MTFAFRLLLIALAAVAASAVRAAELPSGAETHRLLNASSVPALAPGDDPGPSSVARPGPAGSAPRARQRVDGKPRAIGGDRPRRAFSLKVVGAGQRPMTLSCWRIPCSS